MTLNYFSGPSAFASQELRLKASAIRTCLNDIGDGTHGPKHAEPALTQPSLPYTSKFRVALDLLKGCVHCTQFPRMLTPCVPSIGANIDRCCPCWALLTPWPSPQALVLLTSPWRLNCTGVLCPSGCCGDLPFSLCPVTPEGETAV